MIVEKHDIFPLLTNNGNKERNFTLNKAKSVYNVFLHKLPQERPHAHKFKAEPGNLLNKQTLVRGFPLQTRNQQSLMELSLTAG